MDELIDQFEMKKHEEVDNEKNERNFYKDHVLDESEYQSLIETIMLSNVAPAATVIKSDLY